MNKQQLADAMLKGSQAQGVIESRRHYISIEEDLFAPDTNIVCMVCGLGAALVGKYNGDYHEAERAYEKVQDQTFTEDDCAVFARLLQIPISIAVEIEHKHLNGQSIEQIAAWLKGGEA